MELRIIWNMLWRRKWIVGFVFLAMFMLIMLTALLAKPAYTATVHLLVTPPDTESWLLSRFGAQVTQALGQKWDPSMETRAELITTAPVLNSVIASLQLKNRKGQAVQASDMMKSKFPISLFFPEPYVKTEALTDTVLIELTARCGDSNQVARIANAVADAYIATDVQLKRNDYVKIRRFIEPQKAEAEARFLQSLQELQSFQTASQSLDLQAEIKLAIDKMAALVKEKETVLSDTSMLVARLATMKAQLDREALTGVSEGAMRENPQIELIKKNLSGMELRLAEALIEKTTNHPDVVVLNSQIAAAKSELQVELTLHKVSSAGAQAIEQEIAAMDGHLATVNTQIVQQASVLASLPAKDSQFAQIQSRFAVNQKLYNNVLESYYLAGIAEGVLMSDVKVVEPASVPTSASWPNYILCFILAVFFGVLFSIGAGFVAEYMDYTIRTADEVQKTGEMFLGIIPNRLPPSSPLLLRRESRSLREAYRRLWLGLQSRKGGPDAKILMVTSARRRDGRTTIALNLATCLAREGRNVLLLDADRQQPSLHKILDVRLSPGLTEVLSRQTDLSSAVVSTSVKGLSLITRGSTSAEALTETGAAALAESLQSLTTTYDVIIMDSAAVMEDLDAVMMSTTAGMVLFVLRCGKETPGMFAQVMELFRRANVRVSGVVINRPSGALRTG